MKPEIYRASPMLGPVLGGMLAVIYLLMYFVLPRIASDLDGWGTGAVVAFVGSWIAVTGIAALIGMREVLRVDENGIVSRGRRMTWAEIAEVSREDRVINYVGYNSATGVTPRRTQHDLVIFVPKAEGKDAIEVNAALMNMGANALAERMRGFLAEYGTQPAQ